MQGHVSGRGCHRYLRGIADDARERDAFGRLRFIEVANELSPQRLHQLDRQWQFAYRLQGGGGPSRQRRPSICQQRDQCAALRRVVAAETGGRSLRRSAHIAGTRRQVTDGEIDPGLERIDVECR